MKVRAKTIKLALNSMCQTAGQLVLVGQCRAVMRALLRGDATNKNTDSMKKNDGDGSLLHCGFGTLPIYAPEPRGWERGRLWTKKDTTMGCSNFAAPPRLVPTLKRKFFRDRPQRAEIGAGAGRVLPRGQFSELWRAEKVANTMVSDQIVIDEIVLVGAVSNVFPFSGLAPGHVSERRAQLCKKISWVNVSGLLEIREYAVELHEHAWL